MESQKDSRKKKKITKDIYVWLNGLNQQVQELFVFEESIIDNPDPSKWLNLNLPQTEQSLDKILKELFFRNLTCNVCQWILEEKARDPEASPEVIAHVKRNIDIFNQHRNDFIEQINFYLMENYFKKKINKKAPIFSETPGSILDRVHILFLKKNKYSQIFQLNKDHKKREILVSQQIADLKDSLFFLIESIFNKNMQFKLYFQLKTYNDNRFNPFLKNKISNGT